MDQLARGREEAPAALPRAVARFLRESAASLCGQRVLALCSGGIDSVVLVDTLACLPRGERPAQIDVLFLDHGLRAVDREREAAAAVARSHGLEFHERSAGTLLAGAAGNLEARARAWRYAEAAQLAGSTCSDDVATGHSADDQLETFLYGMVASSGARSTCGMPVARGILPGLDVRLVRPLLATARRQVEEYAAARRLQHAQDPTNGDPRFRRNRLRHDVVPALLDVHPGAGANLARNHATMAAGTRVAAELADAMLDVLCDHQGRLEARRVSQLGEAAAGAVVAAWLRRSGAGRALSMRTVAATLQLAGPGAPGREVRLRGGACVRREGYHLAFTPPASHRTSRGPAT